MIHKGGELYINGELRSNRFDKNEDYGVNGQSVEWWEILFEKKVLGFRFCISRKRAISEITGSRIAFDPPILGKANDR